MMRLFWLKKMEVKETIIYHCYHIHNKFASDESETICTRSDERNDKKSDRYFFGFDYYGLLRFPDKPNKDSRFNYNDVLGSSTTSFYPGRNPAGKNSSAIRMETIVNVANDGTNGSYSLLDDVKTKDTASVFHLQEDGYSSLPFLALITVTLNGKTFQIHEPLSKRETSIEYTTDQFIQDIIDVLHNQINKIMYGKYSTHCIYANITTGDFTIALRTDELVQAYLLSVSLNDSLSLSQNGLQVSMSTFATMGMEMPLINRQYVPLSDKKIRDKNCDTIFIMRLHAKDRNTVYSMLPLNCTTGSAYGIFGAYDLTLRVDFDTFGKIYPLICTLKFQGYDKDEFKKIVSLLNVKQQIKDVLNHMDEGELCLVDVRVGVQTDKEDIIYDSNQFGDDAQDQKTWEECIAELENKTYGILDKAEYLPRWHKEYRDNCSLIFDLIAMYRSMGTQLHTACGCKDFLAVMYTLFSSIERYLEYIKENKDSPHGKRAASEFNDFFTRSIETINNFFHLIYGYNLQTVQAPQYELHARLDSRKLLLAYMEYLLSFLTIHRKWMSDRYEDKDIIPLLPVLQVADGEKFSVDIEEPAQMSILRLFPRITSTQSASMELTSINIPALEQLLRMFDMLPQLHHEIVHSQRMIDREQRNKALVLFLLDNVSKKVASKLVLSLARESFDALTFFGEDSMPIFSQSIMEAMCEILSNAENLKRLEELTFKGLIQGLGEKIQDTFAFGEDIEANSKRSNFSLLKYLGEQLYLHLQNEEDQEKLNYLIRKVRGSEKTPDPEKPDEAALKKEVEKYYLIMIDRYLSDLVNGALKSLSAFRSKDIASKKKYDTLMDLIDKGGDELREMAKIKDQDYLRLFAAFDHFYKNIEEHTYSLRDALSAALNHTEKSSDQVEAVRYFVQNGYGIMLHNIKEAINNIIELMNLYSAENNKEHSLAEKGREDLFELTRKKAQQKLEYFKANGGIHYETPFWQGLFNAYPVNNSKEFKELFGSSFDTLTKNDLFEMLDNAKEQYAESSSDLFMCMMTEFTPFGYLWFIAKRFVRKTNTKITIHRITLVIAALISEHSHQCKYPDGAEYLRDGMYIKASEGESSNCPQRLDIYSIEADILCDGLSNWLCNSNGFRKLISDDIKRFEDNEKMKSEIEKFQEGYFIILDELHHKLKICDLKESDVFTMKDIYDIYNETIVDPEMKRKLAGCLTAFSYLESLLNLFINIVHPYSPDSSSETKKYFLYVSYYQLDHFVLMKQEFSKFRTFFCEIDISAEEHLDEIKKWSNYDKAKKMISSSDILDQSFLFTLRYYYRHRFRVNRPITNPDGSINSEEWLKSVLTVI
jgi:hypothetical protein